MLIILIKPLSLQGPRKQLAITILKRIPGSPRLSIQSFRTSQIFQARNIKLLLHGFLQQINLLDGHNYPGSSDSPQLLLQLTHNIGVGYVTPISILLHIELNILQVLHIGHMLCIKFPFNLNITFFHIFVSFLYSTLTTHITAYYIPICVCFCITLILLMAPHVLICFLQHLLCFLTLLICPWAIYYLVQLIQIIQDRKFWSWFFLYILICISISIRICVRVTVQYY